ncbi:DNA polymerase III subunit [Hydrogenivirga sp.]
MRLKDQEAVRDFLDRLQREKKLPGGLLFYGPPGVGKTTAALELARGVLCLNEEPWGCGECLSCIHYERVQKDISAGNWESLEVYEETNGKKVLKYLSGEHPDFVFVPPDGGVVKIDQVRAVRDFAYMKPALSRRKVVIIDEAQTMTREASNSLLKVLEEPPSDTLFVLVSQGKEQLLPTIVSRAYHVEFHPLDEESFYELLGDRDSQLYEVSGGSYTLAEAIREKSELLKLLEDFLSMEPDRVYTVAMRLDKLGLEDKALFLDLLENRIRKTFLDKGLNYDKFEMVVERVSELRNGLGRGLRLGLGLLSLYALWR